MQLMSAEENQRWAALTVRGFAEMSRARVDEAASAWLRAADTLHATPANDSLLAASCSNAAIAFAISEDEEGATRAFCEAAERWERVVDGTATLDVPMAGASSSFHFRLAAKAPDALINAKRIRYRRLAEAALAITRFNRLVIEPRHTVSDVATSAEELQPMLGDILGPRSIEVCLLSASAVTASAFAAYGDKVAEFASRHATPLTALSGECAKLETAVALTALLGPQTFAAIRNRKSKPIAGVDSAIA